MGKAKPVRGQPQDRRRFLHKRFRSNDEGRRVVVLGTTRDGIDILTPDEEPNGFTASELLDAVLSAHEDVPS